LTLLAARILLGGAKAVFLPSLGSRSVALPEKKPVFTEEVTPLGPAISVARRGSQIVYLSPEGNPLCAHAEDDLAAFRSTTSQFCIYGHVKQVDMVRIFCVSPASVRAGVKLYLAHGIAGFYGSPRRCARETKAGSVREQVRQIRLEIAETLGLVLKDRKARAEAVKDGRLRNFTDKWDEPFLE